MERPTNRIAGAAYPHHAHIEPTTLCNLKCRSCNNEGIPSTRKGHLTLLNLKKLIEKNPFLKDISLIGLGEPLLNPEITEMACYLKKKGIAARTCTNGMNLDRVNMEELLDSIDELIISFDSNEKEKFQEIRPGSDFNQIVKNVEKAVEVKRSKSLPVTLSFQTVISKINIHQLENIPPLAKKMGIDKMRFSTTVQYNPNLPDMNKNDNYRKIRDRIQSIQEHSNNDELENQIEDHLQSICKKHNLEFSFSGFSSRFNNCWWPGSGIFITYDGYVTPCCMRMDPSVLNFGNLFRQSFDEIAKGDNFMGFMNSFQQNKCPDICKECPI